GVAGGGAGRARRTWPGSAAAPGCGPGGGAGGPGRAGARALATAFAADRYRWAGPPGLRPEPGNGKRGIGPVDGPLGGSWPGRPAMSRAGRSGRAVGLDRGLGDRAVRLPLLVGQGAVGLAVAVAVQLH